MHELLIKLNFTSRKIEVEISREGKDFKNVKGILPCFHYIRFLSIETNRSSLENKWIFFNKRILEEFPTTQLTTQQTIYTESGTNRLEGKGRSLERKDVVITR